MGGGGLLGGLLNVATLGYTGQREAEKKAKEAQNIAMAEARRQEMEARRIAASAKPMEETATLLTGGSKGSVLGNLGLMVEPTKSKNITTLGGTTTSGLGFGV
jgi:regulator of protease activity HflC (stomatin/prohibitin superfamily)